MTHTPTPWKLQHYIGHEGYIDNQDRECYAGRIVADNDYVIWAGPFSFWSLHNPDNAEFIVRACNSHDELLEALEELVTMVEHAREEGYDNIDYYTTQPARLAIKKAKKSVHS